MKCLRRAGEARQWCTASRSSHLLQVPRRSTVSNASLLMTTKMMTINNNKLLYSNRSDRSHRRSAALISPTYSPVGANMHVPSNAWFLVKLQSALDRFSHFSTARGPDIETDTQTNHVTSSRAIGRIYAMHAMRPIITRQS